MSYVSSLHTSAIIGDMLKPIQVFLDDPDVQEIMVNKPNDVWIERKGVLLPVQVEGMNDDRLYGLIVALGRLSRKDVNDNSPIVDTRLGRHRVAACLSPVSVDGHSLCIRKHGNVNTITDDYARVVADLEPFKGIEPPSINRKTPSSINEFLIWLVVSKQNFIVSGGTSSGKTSFLRAMLKHLSADERVVTIEDPPELKLDLPNAVQFEVNNQLGIDIKKLVRLALRYRPDRIFVGEIRGLEAYDFLSAANSGHDGTACSLHANNPIMALEKLSDFGLMGAGEGGKLDSIKNQVAYTFNYVIQMRRVKGVRTIETIHRVIRHNGKDFETQIIL